MNVRLRESENETQFVELFFDTEELEVIGVGVGKLVGGILEGEGKNVDFRTFDILGEIGIRAFNFDSGFFTGNNLSRVFNPVEDAVSNFLDDIIDGNGGAGILKTTAAMITGGGGKQRTVGGEEGEADKSKFLNERNESMKDLLIEGFTDTTAEVGEGCLTWDAIATNTGETAVVVAAQRIAQDKAEIANKSNSIQITEQIEKEKRNGIIAGTTENGIGIGCNGTYEREINGGSDKLRQAALNGSIVVDLNKFLFELVMGKPTSFFFGKWFRVSDLDERVDFAELSDKIGNREAGGLAHLKTPRVSREKIRPTKRLPGNPFLFVNANHPTSTNPIQTNASDSSISTNTGGAAFWSFSCA